MRMLSYMIITKLCSCTCIQDNNFLVLNARAWCFPGEKKSSFFSFHSHSRNRFLCIGVTLSFTLSWSPHITLINCKVIKLLGLLYRRFYSHLDSSKLLIKLYICLIRPIIVSRTIEWDPHMVKDVDLLEQCQIFLLEGLACMLATQSSVLDASGLPTLQNRRKYFLCFCFRPFTYNYAK